MIDHIKLAEECGIKVGGTSFSGGKFRTHVDADLEALQAYTNAILEHAAVKCDEQEQYFDERDEVFCAAGAERCGMSIRQEKV